MLTDSLATLVHTVTSGGYSAGRPNGRQQRPLRVQTVGCPNERQQRFSSADNGLPLRGSTTLLLVQSAGRPNERHHLIECRKRAALTGVNSVPSECSQRVALTGINNVSPSADCGLL